MAPIRSFPFVSVRFRSFPFASVRFRWFPFVSVRFRSFLLVSVRFCVSVFDVLGNFLREMANNGCRKPSKPRRHSNFVENRLPERPQKTTPRPPNFDECLKKSIPRVFSPLSFLIHCLMLTNLPKAIRNLSHTVKAQSGVDQKAVRNQPGIYQTMCEIQQGIGNK